MAIFRIRSDRNNLGQKGIQFRSDRHMYIQAARHNFRADTVCIISVVYACPVPVISVDLAEKYTVPVP